jgi:hypothetical protein
MMVQVIDLRESTFFPVGVQPVPDWPRLSAACEAANCPSLVCRWCQLILRALGE